MHYLEQLIERFWKYRALRFQGQEYWFDQPTPRRGRPPAFLQEYETWNVLVHPSLTGEQAAAVRTMLPPGERHPLFRSMRSSQALVQSVFANLRVMGLCHLLQPVRTEEGLQPFGTLTARGEGLVLEHRLSTLGEPRPTSVDVYVDSGPHVAIECKLAEDGIGQCSRPGLGEEDKDYCDGNYRQQKGRRERCALTECQIRYWEFIPRLFRWDSGQDLSPCPVRSTYQLMRNVLAASVTPEGAIRPGMAVLLFDARNPAFQPGGRGHDAYSTVKAALLDPKRLQRMTWQALVEALGENRRLDWLTSELNCKYGLSPRAVHHPV